MEHFWLFSTNQKWIRCIGDEVQLQKLSCLAKDRIRLVVAQCDIGDEPYTTFDIDSNHGLEKLEQTLLPNVISLDSAERFHFSFTKDMTVRYHSNE